MTVETVRMTILLIVSHLAAMAIGIYFYERYWPKLQAVLREIW